MWLSGPPTPIKPIVHAVSYKKNRGNAGKCRIWSRVGGLQKRVSQKLRRIILLHFWTSNFSISLSRQSSSFSWFAGLVDASLTPKTSFLNFGDTKLLQYVQEKMPSHFCKNIIFGKSWILENENLEKMRVGISWDWSYIFLKIWNMGSISLKTWNEKVVLNMGSISSKTWIEHFVILNQMNLKHLAFILSSINLRNFTRLKKENSFFFAFSVN